MNAESKPLNHEQFLQAYALNRALGHKGGLDGYSAAYEAEAAWQKIQTIMISERERINNEIKNSAAVIR